MRYVLVTTEHRGVFFGQVGAPDEDDPGNSKTSMALRNARNCVSWSSDIHGCFGLAATGPSADCRIGPKVPKLTLYGITSVTECTEEAVKAWEAEPWN